MANPPQIVKHNFLFAFDLTTASADGSQTYRCSHCQAWTADPKTGPAALAVCSQRDRRTKQRREQKERRA